MDNHESISGRKASEMALAFGSLVRNRRRVGKAPVINVWYHYCPNVVELISRNELV